MFQVDGAKRPPQVSGWPAEGPADERHFASAGVGNRAWVGYATRPMTRLAVSIMVRNLEQALAGAACAAERGAELVEFRIDRFTQQPQLLAQLVERSSLPCIVTCRPTWEGGEFDGSEATRIAMFEHAASGSRHPAYIDIELVAYRRSPDLRQRIDCLVDHPGNTHPTTTGLILSSHDFDGRPVDLYQRLEAMISAPACRVMKVAWQARSLRDNIEVFETILNRHKPTIALCMGEQGLPSRVLAKKFGALLTFATLESGSATAQGQPTIDDLKHLYRWDALGPETRVYGVIGHPVAHSMSPALHNAGFEDVDYDGVYLPLPIAAGYEPFKATVETWIDMPALHFRGASVTIPHKENLLRYVQEAGGQIEPLAQQIGAANTLTIGHDGTLHASNTDYTAALDAVCDSLAMTRSGLKGKRVAVIGAGGVARAIVAGFAHCGATVVVYNRTVERAQDLAEQFNGRGGQVTAAGMDCLSDGSSQIYINCTPLGMFPDTQTTPIPDGHTIQNWGPGTVVFDTVYNPVETHLLNQARAAGCVIIPGTEMFVRQAATQFRLWTGHDAPLDGFRALLRDRLKG